MYIVTANEMCEIDRYATKTIGIDGKLLMENAGRAVSEKIESIVKKTDDIRIFTGSGNNGGDGFVIARTLLNKGYHISVVQVVPSEKISGVARYHKTLFSACGGKVNVTWQPAEIEAMVRKSDIVVDAILGIGTNGMLREPISKVVSIMNDAAAYIISVDIPSGLPADEGIIDFQAVQANRTIIVETPKVSTFLQHTVVFYGVWETVSIGLPVKAVQANAKKVIWTQKRFRQTIPERAADSHKGDHGRGLVVGGSENMPGSIALTVNAALRAGAGLVTAAATEHVKSTVASHCLEATYVTPGESDGFLTNDIYIPFETFDAAVLGMGMGRRDVTGDLVKTAVKDDSCPLIVDADGLYHLKPILDLTGNRTYPTILTPHPGEMAMLLDITVKELLVKPFTFSKMLAEAYQIHIVLKGKFTVITAPDGKQAVSTAGNEGLAKGGSGDVLSGVILAMVMQKQDPFDALCNACFVHGEAADLLIAETNAVYDLTASDVINGISKVYRTFL